MKINIGQIVILIFLLLLLLGGNQQVNAASMEEWLITGIENQKISQEKKIRMQKNVYPGMVLSKKNLKIKNESGKKVKLFLSVQSKSDEMDWFLSEIFFSKSQQQIRTRFKLDGINKRTDEFFLDHDEEATVETLCTINGELIQNRHQNQQFQFYWEFVAVAEHSQYLPSAGESVQSNRNILLTVWILLASLLWRSSWVKITEAPAQKVK